MITNQRTTSTEANAASLSAAKLQPLFKGEVITPGDSRYDQVRTVHAGGIDRCPTAIVRVANAEDVARLITLARETGLELAIRSGGHSLAGHGVTDGGLMLDLSAMKDLQIDHQECTAWAETGLTAGEYTFAAAKHGLATGFGDTPSVGIGGITLGGGVGYLVRKYGMTIDQLLAAEIVTADGQLLHVDAESHPDLFWAMRGGGGNFGVATRFKFQLHEVDNVVGGMMILPATADVIAGFIREADAAPDELSTIVNIMPAPPMPFLPKEMHGRLVVLALMMYAGDAGSGQRVLAPFRALAVPLADMVRPIHYPEIYQPEEEGGSAPIISARTLFVDSVDTFAAAEIIEYLKSSTAGMSLAQLRVLGGAMARVPADATAFAHRQSRVMVNLMALYGEPNQRSTHETWVSNFADALRQSDSGAYVNFLGDVSEDEIHAAYPGRTWDRLAAIKARYDPRNFFHMNQNIPPAKK